MSKVSVKFKCDMSFMRGECKFEAYSQRRVLQHQQEVHEPEGLAINGFEPGYVEPARIHNAQVEFNPYRVTKRWTEAPNFQAVQT